jgi:CRP-like cAMP-binding protein
VRQLELTERMLRLRSVPVFRAMAANDLAQLAASIRPRAFARGEVLLREDLPPRSFFLLNSGTVTMMRQGRRIGTVRGPGGVGFLSFLAQNAGGTSAVAQSYVEGFEVPAEAMEEVFEDHFVVLLGTIRWLAQRLLAENQAAAPPPFVAPTVSFDHLIGDRELGIVERIFLLRRARAFARANVNSLARLARRMEEVRVPARTTLWKVGEPADHTFFSVKGMARLIWSDGEKAQIVGPGYALGGIEALVGVPRWNELVTDEPAILLRGNRERLIDLFEDDRDFAMSFMALFATMLMSVWDRKAEAGQVSVGSAESHPMLVAEEAQP